MSENTNPQSLAEQVAAVIHTHGVAAFCGTDTACRCDRTWRSNADHEAHVAAAVAVLMAPAQARLTAVLELADRIERHGEYESGALEYRDADSGGWIDVADAIREAAGGPR